MQAARAAEPEPAAKPHNERVEKAERDLILRQGVVLPETPRDRREREGLEEDLLANPRRGRPLSLRLTNFGPSADAYLAASRGPLAYMLRLHEIERQTEAQEERLAEAWHACARAADGDQARFEHDWRQAAENWSFDEINGLIERHNRWYPVESRLPMDPQTGDHALVNGRDYRLPPRGADWIFERFPPTLVRATAAS
jgi:hypothetical protein